MLKKILSTITFLLILVTAVRSQDILTLDSCRQKALMNNAKVVNADNNIRGAQALSKAAYLKFFPSLQGELAGFYSPNNLMPMPNGVMGTDELEHGWFLDLVVNAPIYAGGRINNRYKKSQLEVEMAHTEKQLAEKDVLKDVDRLYWNLVALEGKLRTLTAADTLLKEVERVAGLAVKNGLRNRNDLLQVQLERNENESEVSKITNAIEVNRMMLAQYMGIDSHSFKIADAVDTSEGKLLTGSVITSGNASATTDIQLLRQKVKSAEYEVKLEKSNRLPEVGVEVSYGMGNVGGFTIGPFFLGIAKIPISEWFTGKHNLRSKELKLQNARTALDDNTRKMDIKIRSLLLDVEDARRQVSIAAKSIEQARENLRINQSSYLSGMTIMSELLKAQNILQKSESKYIEAYSTYQIKLSEYQQAIR